VIEAATDPRWSSAPAFSFDPNAFVSSPWLVAGAELADLCEYRYGPASFVREGSFVAALVWSNVAAAANDRDPCAPADARVPFSTISIEPNEIQAAMPGETVTFAITAWSTARVPTFQINALVGAPADGAFAPESSIDRTDVNNGDRATLTVRVPLGTASGTYGLTYVQVTDARGGYDFVPVVVYVP
jgi:hypothetical protein